MLDAAVVGLNNEMLFIIRVLFRRSFFFDFHILRCVLTIFNIYKFISQLFCAVGDSAAQNIFCLPKIQILYICSSAGRRAGNGKRQRSALDETKTVPFFFFKNRHMLYEEKKIKIQINVLYYWHTTHNIL